MCDCISKMNDVLREHNTALTVPLLGEPRALVDVYQVETGRGKKRAVHVFANHCPFCGEKYAREAQSSRGIQ